jgi:hypothetical protein
MRNERTRRIGRREMRRLLAGVSGAADPTGLGFLLDLAAGPPTPAELAGLHEAVQRFRHTHRDPAPASASTRSGRGVVALATRALAVKVAAVFGVLLLGGVALAASTGHLPQGVQQRAHDLVAPLGISLPNGSGPNRSGSSVATRGVGPTGAASTAATAGLCRAWQQETAADQGTATMTPASRALADLAGGANKIATFCASVLKQAGSSDATGEPVAPEATPAHPGNGNGRPTPTPHPTPHA